ncbi:carbohydrate kinase family protein [Sutcliffiella halmapala]|uniref:carbohydrate kinase family protein n=1 Tax=Sutcliffiella halmapala TaxID=79882 RepID=UPI000994AD3F|nr:carbohydrate kinase [Sutcliffiella halmapala]
MKVSTSIFCIGELLIDFFCTDVDIDLVEGHHFEKQAGGAPANVCATVVKLGGNALFCGKVGNDPFGEFLINTLAETKVDTSMIVRDTQHPTTLAFVSLKADGERDFTFNRGADAYLQEVDIDKAKLKKCSILHFGSATALLQNPFQETYLNTMKSEKDIGKFISFDPNFRKDLWVGRVQVFVDLAKEGIALADFVKVSEEELEVISGKKDVLKGAKVFHDLGAKIVAVTLGKEGTFISNGQRFEIVPSIAVKSIDSTGAGDAFVGATLYQLAKEVDIKSASEDFNQLKQIISFSNKVGALVCTKVGAISALPSVADVENIEEISVT